MEITIKDQRPDGVNVNFTNVVFDTYEEVVEAIRKIEKIQARLD